jgi:hypothetical protein
MNAPALKALAAAKTAGVTITLDGDGLILEADPLPPDIVALLRTVKPDLLPVLAGREAARSALDATAPPDCLPQRWVAAQESLRRFVRDGWCDQAALLGWTADELYRVPPLWSRVDVTGAALLVGERRIVALTDASLAIETPSGSRLKFRRIGREHLA